MTDQALNLLQAADGGALDVPGSWPTWPGAVERRPRARALTWPTSTRRPRHGPTLTARRWPRRRPRGAG